LKNNQRQKQFITNPKTISKTHANRERQTRLYLNSMPETNANFRDKQTEKKDRKLNAQRLVLAVWRCEEPTRPTEDTKPTNER